MNFEESLCAELQSIAGLERKVFPQKAEENTEPPFIVYISSDGERIRTLDGYTDLTELNFEVTVVTNSYDQLKSYVQAISSKIRSFFGRTIGTDGVYIKSVSFVEPNEDFQDNQSYYKSTFNNVRVRF